MTPLEQVRAQFVGDLLRGAREGCVRAVDEVASTSAPLTVIYQQLFRDGLYEVGDRWSRGQMSVAEEHLATAIVEGLMVDLFARAATTPPNGRSAVSVCVGSELHQVGGRMVADVLEAEGWRCAFLAGPLAPGDLLAAVEREQATLVAFSVTMTDHLDDLAREVAALRAGPPQVAVIAGGLALRERGAEVCAGLDRVTWVPDLDRLLAFAKSLCDA
jgi:MerR family transcriptional regulator, light-induced transcriptional regulator